MTEPVEPRRTGHAWSSPQERIAVVALLVLVLLAALGATVILGIHHDIDKAGLTAILGTIAGGTGSALVHKLSSRS